MCETCGCGNVVLTKCDLLPHLDVDLAALEDALARTMPATEMLQVSAKTGEGIGDWVAWIERQRERLAGGVAVTTP